MGNGRIGIVQIKQESNSFNPLKTEFESFEASGIGLGNEVVERYGEVNEIGGFLEGLSQWSRKVTPVGILRAEANPGGPARDQAVQRLLHLLQQELAACRPDELDGLLVSLHGSMISERDPDVEGTVLETIREVVGPTRPMVVSLDLHANVTRRMLENATLLVGYRTAPHVDVRETGVRAAQLLGMVFAGARPQATLLRLPMITMSERHITYEEPLRSIFREVDEMEHTDLSASLFMTQPWLDVPGLGWSVLLYSDGPSVERRTRCNHLAERCWARRADLNVRLLPPEECIRIAREARRGPVVVSESADATNSGAAGDGTNLLRALAAEPIPGGALTILVDPAAVAHAQQAGVGGAFDAAVGGTRDSLRSKPLRLRGTVIHVGPARYTLSGHGGTNVPVDMGPSAVVRSRDVTVLLVSRPGPGGTPSMYRCVGLEPQDYRLVVVKSPSGFRADFGPFAEEMIVADTPGAASGNLRSFTYTQACRPLWPLDEIHRPDEAPWPAEWSFESGA